MIPGIWDGKKNYRYKVSVTGVIFSDAQAPFER